MEMMKIVGLGVIPSSVKNFNFAYILENVSWGSNDQKW